MRAIDPKNFSIPAGIATTMTVLAVLASVVGAPRAAHAEEKFGDCSKAPAEAKLDIPAPLDQIAQVYCLPNGHFIHGADLPEKGVSYRWTRIDAAEAVVMHAHFDGTPKGYFTAFNLTPMIGLGKTAAMDKFKAVAKWTGGDPQAYSLRATNDKGQTRAMVVMISAQQSGGFICDNGDCKNILPFQIVKLVKSP